MTVFDLIARERTRVARLVRVDTWTRAAVAVVAALTLGALLLGGSRWIALPRVVPFAVWTVAAAAALYLARRGADALRRVAASETIADEVEREQKMRRGAVRGIIELSGDTSAFVARAAQRLGERLAPAGAALAPALQRRLRRGAMAAAAVLVPVVLIAAFVGAKRPDGFRALAHPVDAWRGALLPRLQIADAPSRALRGSTLKLTVRASGRSTVALRRRSTGNAWVETALTVSNGTVSTELGPLDADLTLVASDGRAMSDTVVVRVVDRPFLGDVAVRATYPAYLHRASEALPGDAPIRVPKGTDLEIEGHASESLASVWLVQERDSIRLRAGRAPVQRPLHAGGERQLGVERARRERRDRRRTAAARGGSRAGFGARGRDSPAGERQPGAADREDRDAVARERRPRAPVRDAEDVEGDARRQGRSGKRPEARRWRHSRLGRRGVARPRRLAARAGRRRARAARRARRVARGTGRDEPRTHPSRAGDGRAAGGRAGRRRLRRRPRDRRGEGAGGAAAAHDRRRARGRREPGGRREAGRPDEIRGCAAGEGARRRAEGDGFARAAAAAGLQGARGPAQGGRSARHEPRRAAPRGTEAAARGAHARHARGAEETRQLRAATLRGAGETVAAAARGAAEEDARGAREERGDPQARRRSRARCRR